MILADSSFDFFSVIQNRVRSSFDNKKINIPYRYEGESFFQSYESIFRVWKKRESQRYVTNQLGISRTTFKELESSFMQQGVIGLLSLQGVVEVDPLLERLVILVNEARPHTNSGHIQTLANALQIPDVNIEVIRRIQRSHGYGQRQNETDRNFYSGLQKIFESISYHQSHKGKLLHAADERSNNFLNYDRDYMQHKVELFRTLNGCSQSRQVRNILQQFGIHSSRFYALKERYLQYGIWGLIDLIHSPRRKGEKISADLELKIIEQRLLNPTLSTRKMIVALKLNCSQTNIQKIYSRWGLVKIKEAKPIKGILSSAIPDKLTHDMDIKNSSTRSRFPTLLKVANLKVNGGFERFINRLSYRSVPISNPGAIITAPFLDQLGIIEAIHTYGPEQLRTSEISNDIILNIFRIIAGFPTINNYMQNSDRSVSIASGRLSNPSRSKFYLELDSLSFEHLQKLRNDVAIRAKELNIIDGKQISIDYHCDPSDSKFPNDKGQSKAPDKNGNVIYAHRPQLLWDSDNNTIINIAYCEGRSRAPTALYKFLEHNLFEIISPDAINEIYADSEYTGEKQLVYLLLRSGADVTMCLKQNHKIKKWKEQTIALEQWEDYGKNYRIASLDFTLPETNKKLRFVVKQNIETFETRCFGSTHIDLSAKKILDRYHIRWSVENGIKDLVENYFLDKPTGDSPEKVEVHYYCVMVARLLIDYFSSVFNEPCWNKPEGWQSVLSTIRTSIFSNQNCELSLDESGDLLLTYLDGDPSGIKTHLKEMLEKRTKSGLNKVSWWGNRGVKIRIEDRYNFESGSENG
jgi:hypothetical protein